MDFCEDFTHCKWKFLYNYMWNKHFVHSNSYFNFCFTRADAWTPNLVIKENVLMERQFNVIFWPDFGYQRKCFTLTKLSHNILTKMWISVQDLHTVSAMFCKITCETNISGIAIPISIFVSHVQMYELQIWLSKKMFLWNVSST